MTYSRTNSKIKTAQQLIEQLLVPHNVAIDFRYLPFLSGVKMNQNQNVDPMTLKILYFALGASHFIFRLFSKNSWVTSGSGSLPRLW